MNIETINSVLYPLRIVFESAGRLAVSSGSETQIDTAQASGTNDTATPRFETGEYDLRVVKTAGESACRLFDQDSV